MSTGGQTNVDAVVVNALIAQVDAALRETNRALTRVESVRGSIAGSFRGGASPTFDRSIQAWSSRAGEIARDLQRIHAALQEHRRLQGQLAGSTQTVAGGWARA
jgi:uncharacterized protein YukE